MRKYLTVIFAAMMAALALTACGGGSEKEVTIGVDELAGKLAMETVTSDQLAAVSSEILASTYFIEMDKVEDSAAYLSSGASACEAAVIKCKEADYASEVAELLKNRAKNQSTLYASYNAAEAKKLDNAIVRTSGKYVVLCVADDMEKAESILEDAGFKL